MKVEAMCNNSVVLDSRLFAIRNYLVVKLSQWSMRGNVMLYSITNDVRTPITNRCHFTHACYHQLPSSNACKIPCVLSIENRRGLPLLSVALKFANNNGLTADPALWSKTKTRSLQLGG